MTRLTIEDLTGDMPEQKIIEALDDDGDGIIHYKFHYKGCAVFCCLGFECRIIYFCASICLI